MKDSIKVYSLPTCGMCKMLKRTLDNKQIHYTVCEDTEEMARMNITSVPVMSVDGELYNFKEALKMVNSGGLN